eukprot:PhF_6_TR16984/c0_g1_i1/m.25687
MDHSDIILELQHSESIITSFFSFLEYQGHGKSALTGINVPDSIVYGYSKPLAWFFTQDSTLHRQPKAKMTSVEIYNHLVKKGKSTSGVKAVFMIPGPSRTGQGATITFKYANGNELLSLLQTERSPGLLQLYVDPKPLRSDGVKQHTITTCSWSRGCCMIDCLTSRAAMDDKTSPMSERFASDDDPQHTVVTRLLSEGARMQYRGVCDLIVKHLETVYGCAVISMSLHFRKDMAGVLWLLYCSSLKIQNRATGAVVQSSLWSPANPFQDKPQRVASRAALPFSKVSLNDGYVEGTCILCATVPEGSALTKVQKQWVLLSMSKMDANCDFDVDVPSSVLMIYPHMTKEQFDKVKVSKVWMEEPLLVCEVCLRACIEGTVSLGRGALPPWLMTSTSSLRRRLTTMTASSPSSLETSLMKQPESKKKELPPSPSKEKSKVQAVRVLPDLPVIQDPKKYPPGYGVDFYVQRKTGKFEKLCVLEEQPIPPRHPLVTSDVVGTVSILGTLNGAKRKLLSLSSENARRLSTPQPSSRRTSSAGSVYKEDGLPRHRSLVVEGDQHHLLSAPGGGGGGGSTRSSLAHTPHSNNKVSHNETPPTTPTNVL